MRTLKTYRIRPLPLIKMELDMGILTYRYNYGTKIQAPVYCWYIEGAEQNILVDSGADAELATSFRGFPTEEIMTFEEALAS
ncbi:MAG: N-acyl homoserine lactonase family protein, partial [Dehalococcoidia bacterium]|nr:N-acyl homoserine lactonase family protein [Dehalococcoidia bacterium]